MYTVVDLVNVDTLYPRERMLYLNILCLGGLVNLSLSTGRSNVNQHVTY